MNTKRLITASIFSLISASTALAADVMMPHQPASSTTSTIVAPTFSWTGLYLGVQAGGFSSKADMALVGQEKSLPLDKEFSPKLSGFVGGFYAGSNIDLGDNFIFGIDTDLMISGKKHTKTITIGAADNTTVENAVVRSRRSVQTQTPPVPRAVTSEGTQGSASEKSVGTQSSQAPAQPVTTVQSSRAGEAQSNQSATTGKSSDVSATAGKTVTSERTSGVPTPSSKTPSESSVTQPVSPKTVQAVSSSLGRSDTGGASLGEVGRSQPAALKPTSLTTGVGTSASRSAVVDQSSGVRANGANAPVNTVLVVPAQVQPAPVKPTATAPAVQPAAKAPTSVQPSAVERTVPSSSLVLARSGSSNGSETKVSNGISGAQQGGHHSSSHSSGNANAHGAPHAGGHSSGAHPNGTNPHASRSHGGQNMSGHGAQSTQAVDKNASSVYGIEQIKKMASELGLDQEDAVETLSHTFKQNWGGATRVRIGFAADRFMPYLAGGIAYGQFQDTVSISVKDEDGRVVSSKNLADETKTMIGYTLGGGVDFSLLDNVIVRAEYRYSDFGKKKFAKEKLEVNYKTNDFRVGVAYKF
ncbi:outer membrane beta-barrel protein [Bartonella sp. AP36NXGY]|uniref:outer membrane protein n=1 Tax=Bartonella sp. AP36NXGY TaxID=3243493 RepID=UPI0035D1338C